MILTGLNLLKSTFARIFGGNILQKSQYPPIAEKKQRRNTTSS